MLWETKNVGLTILHQGLTIGGQVYKTFYTHLEWNKISLKGGISK